MQYESLYLCNRCEVTWQSANQTIVRDSTKGTLSLRGLYFSYILNRYP